MMYLIYFVVTIATAISEMTINTVVKLINTHTTTNDVFESSRIIGTTGSGVTVVMLVNVALLHMITSSLWLLLATLLLVV